MKFIERPRLAEHIRETIAQHTLTLIAAPLGTGKSASLTLAFSESAGFARLDVEAQHRGAFLPALVATVRERRDDFGRLTLGALAAGASASHLARTFALELGHVRTPLVIALDNAHVLYEDPAFGEFLRVAQELLPQPVRLVLAGRGLPDFELVHAFATGRAAIVRDIFRFNSDEILLLASGIGRSLESSELATIERATDGWAAGVVLALVTRSAGDGVGSIASATAYLETALLPELAPGTVAFLEDTAVFEVLEPGMLERSLFPNARTMLDDLQRSGALVSELPGRKGFRLNPLLRDLALRRLTARGGLMAAHGAAVDAYVAANATTAAMFHALSANDARIAGKFLRSHAFAAINTGERVRVLAGAALIDTNGPDADVAAFVQALAEKAAGSPKSRDSFVLAARAAERSGDASIAFFARAQTIEYDLGRLRRIDADELDAICSSARKLGPVAIATAEMLAGWAEAIGFDFEAARARIVPLAHGGEARARFDTGVLLAYVQTALGECELAAATLENLVRLLEDDDRVVLQTLALVWFARLALAWGTIDVALDAATHAERLAAALELRAEEAALYSVLTELATHRGDVAATIAYAERARERSRSAWYVADVERIRAFADIAAARAAFLSHENATALGLVRRASESPKIPEPARALALTEAALYTLLCEPRAAPTAITAAREAVRGAVAVDVGDAVALATAGDLLSFLAAANDEPIGERLPLPGPFDALIEARRGLVTLEVAGIAVGNARRGRGSAEALAAVFERYGRNGPRFEARLARAYASRFVHNVKQPPNAKPAFDLTSREREILTLLVDGLTNKELAQRLLVSPRTVETHVERVLGKLEVGSRSRAIAKALRLGIVTLEPSFRP